MLAQKKVKTPVGEFYLVSSDKGLRQVVITKQKGIPEGAAVSARAKNNLLKAETQIQEYFEGKRKTFSIPLDLQGTEFQKKVWAGLLAIPFGNTLSYGDLARQIGSPRACRAVGGANGKNPICIIVPCHRVIAADGGIGGYSSGINMKKYLLTLEGASHS